ncbi:MAG: glycoside hydrolase family 18 protein [Anaerolineales bacterium]
MGNRLRTGKCLLLAAAVILSAAGCGNLEFETAPASTQGTAAVTQANTPERSEVAMDSPYRLVGYYASWNVYNRAVFLSQLQGEKLTHLNYAFSNISPEGECVNGDLDADTIRFFGGNKSVSAQTDPVEGLRGNFRQLALLKEKYPALKVLISVGGWTWSEHFSDAALSETSRMRFVKSCLDLYLVRYGDAFDGVDLDWEYPVAGGLYPGRPEDGDNYTLLAQEFRNQMNTLREATGKEYLLTIAGPAAPDTIGHFHLGEIQKSLDWINVMAYDFHVASEPTTGLLSPLYGSPRDPDGTSRESYNGDAAVRAYLAAGVPADKIVLGIPFYGRSWRGTGGNGLFQSAQGPAMGRDEPGFMSYSDIAQGPLKTFQRYWEEDAKVPWLHETETGVFISYEDAESIEWKVRYIREKGLGGAMVWELGLDGGMLLGPLGDGLFS